MDEPQRASGLWRLLTPATATAVGVLSLLVLAGACVMSLLVPSATASFTSAEDAVATVGQLLFGLPFTVVGVVVARRQPRNPMGWLLLAVALAIELGSVAPAYAYLDYSHDGTLPLGHVAVLLSGVWIVAFVLLPLIILLFPDGRARSALALAAAAVPR